MTAAGAIEEVSRLLETGPSSSSSASYTLSQVDGEWNICQVNSSGELQQMVPFDPSTLFASAPPPLPAPVEAAVPPVESSGPPALAGMVPTVYPRPGLDEDEDETEEEGNEMEGEEASGVLLHSLVVALKP